MSSNVPLLGTDLPEQWIAHTQCLLDSYGHWKGVELIERSGTWQEQAWRLFVAPRVVVAHGTEADPLLNYGNRLALELWELDIPALLRTASRLTAEPMHRDERANLLARTRRDGFVDDYRGIRISQSGKRFYIERACVWNLINDQGKLVGQAATFEDWQPIESPPTLQDTLD